MNQITGYATVPSTSLLSAPATSVATTTVTKVVTKTVREAAHTSFYAASKHWHVSTSALASGLPVHLVNQVTDLFERARKGAFTKFSPLLLAMKYGLGVMVVYGIGAAIGRFPIENVPPGENPRTWRQKATFAYNFPKNAAKQNEQLRRSIEKARQENEERRSAEFEKLGAIELRNILKIQREEPETKDSAA